MAETIDLRKTAVALEYDPERDAAPTIAAKGYGDIAERILDIAQESGVPVYKDAALAAGLMAFELDQMIPAELYQAVAEVLTFIYRMDDKARLKKRP